jgi:hypothetical protein
MLWRPEDPRRLNRNAYIRRHRGTARLRTWTRGPWAPADAVVPIPTGKAAHARLRGGVAGLSSAPRRRVDHLVGGSQQRLGNQRLRRKSNRMLMSGSRPRYGRTAWTGKQTVYGSAASAAGLQRRYIQYNDG